VSVEKLERKSQLEGISVWNDREWSVTIQLAWDRVQYMYKIVKCRYQILLSVADLR
jgi:hypothetical protein